MNPHQSQDNPRIDNLEQGLGEIKDDVKNIRENHLVHLSEDMAVLKTKMDGVIFMGKTVAGLSVASVGGSILNLILK